MNYDVLSNRLGLGKDNVTTDGQARNTPPVPHAHDSSGGSNSRSTSNASTPSRKVSSQSKFSIPFTSHFYSNETTSDVTDVTRSPTSGTVRPKSSAEETYPEIKGKLMSMWQNVKYGLYFSQVYFFLLQ